MAGKPIDPRPVALPNLSQLPNPTKDLFGGMTSPTALMSMSEKEVNDLFSVKPLIDPHIKPSAEAAKALQVAQARQDAITRQAQQAQEQLARQQQEIAAQRQRALEEQIKLIRKDAKERAEALKEKAEQQGGKLGAGADGSFLLTNNINELLKSEKWNSVVSDKQRRDRAEEALAEYAEQLRAMGATDEQIANEIENGRNMLIAHTDAYAKSMLADNAPVLDTAKEFFAGAGKMVTSVTGGTLKLLGADRLGDDILLRNKTIQEWTDEQVSNKGKLEKANYAYEADKYYREHNINPELDLTDLKSTGATLKLAYQNGTLDSIVTEQLPNILAAIASGSAGAVAGGIFALKYGTKLPTVAKILTGNLKTGSRILDKVVLPHATGAGLGVGGYGTLATISDAGAGAWQEVRDTDFKTIRKVYGENMWKKAVEIHGSEEAARNALADEAFNRAAKRIAPVAVATSFLGAEATIAGMFARQAVKNEAKKLTAKGVLKGAGSAALTALEEGFEEGYTQYSSNTAANPYTGVNPDQGVAEAAGLGALMGGGITAVSNALSTFAKEAQELPSPDYAQEFVKQGFFDDKQFRQHFERHMAWYEKQYQKDNDTTINDVQHYKQTHYNGIVDRDYTITREDGTTDTKSIWDLMTPEQEQNFKQYVRSAYGINTNNYAPHQDTAEYDAIKNSDMDVLTRPENEDLLNTWRVLNNTDVDQIPADRRAYYQALADTTAYLQPTESTHNTNQREQIFSEFRETNLQQRGLTENQIADIVGYARDILGANSRRFTDAEQQAWDAQQATRQAQGGFNQSQEQTNGTYEQDQTRTGQPSGQRPSDENAEPVAEEDPRTNRSEATTLRQAAEELADAFAGRPPSPNAQSPRDDNTRQGADPSGQTDTSAQDGAGASAGNAGFTQTQATGFSNNSTTAQTNRGATTQSGNTGQTNQAGEPTRQTSPSSTQTTAGSRSTGASQTERNTNGRSKQTLTERANELGKTGVDIPIDVVEQFIIHNSPNNLGIKIIREYVGKRLNVAVTKNTPSEARVLQHLAKLTDVQFSTELPAIFFGKKGKIRKDSHEIINDLHDTRHDLYKVWDKIRSKINAEQTTTDTNNTNGLQDVDDTNVADTADENPQAAVEQPVQTADDVENINDAEELIDDVVDAIWYAYGGDVDFIDLLSSIYEHYDELNDYFHRLPNAAEQLENVFTELADTQEDGGVFEAILRYWEELAKQRRSTPNEQETGNSTTATPDDDRQTQSQTNQTGTTEQTEPSQGREPATDQTPVKRPKRGGQSKKKQGQSAVEQDLEDLIDETNLNAETVREVLTGVVLSETDIIAEIIKRLKQDAFNELDRLTSFVDSLTGASDNDTVAAYVYNNLHKPNLDVRAEFLITLDKLFPNRTNDDTQWGEWEYFFLEREAYIYAITKIAEQVQPILGNNTLANTYSDNFTEGDVLVRVRELLDEGPITIDGIATQVETIKVIQHISREILSDTYADIGVSDPTPTTTETTNVSEQDQTQAEPRENSPTSYTISAQDTAGTSGLFGDTQTSANQAGQPTPATPILGNETYISVRSNRHPAKFRLIEAAELNPSEELGTNQGRDRTRTGSKDQIAEIAKNLDPLQVINETSDLATGTPVITGNGVVIAGNGRTMAIQQAYSNGSRGQKYKNHLTAKAGNFGFTTEQVRSMEQPILVRDAGNLNTETIRSWAIDSNDQGTLSQSAIEKARTDLDKLQNIDLGALRISDTGEINFAGNRPLIGQFVNSFPVETRNAMLQGGGLLSREGLQRFENALLIAAYGDTEITNAVLEDTTTDGTNFKKMMVSSAPKIAQTKQLISDGNTLDADISSEVSNAIHILLGLRRQQVSAESYLAQLDAFGKPDDVTLQLLSVFDTKANAPAALRNLMTTYYDNLQAQAGDNQGYLVGFAPLTKKELLDHTFKAQGYSDLIINPQEQTNETQDNLGQSVQPTQEQATDGNEVVRTRTDNQQVNDGQGEVPRQSGQPVSEQSQTGGNETTQDTQQLGVTTESDGRNTIWNYLNDNSADLEIVRGYLAKQRTQAQQGAETNAESVTNDDVIDFIEQTLGDRPFTDKDVAQAIDGTRDVRTSGITFDSLPTSIQNILNKIWEKVKSTVAAVSMAIAVATGTTLTIPTDANAATHTETSVVQNIISQNDNQSKPFVVADKQAGTLTVYSPTGVEITSSPALFGKTEGDSVSSKNTPSGRFETKQARVTSEGYGGSAQVLTQNGRNVELDNTPYAIHRVYTRYASENRQGRLDSATATDNRISHGCINVPDSFYDTYLDTNQDMVVYVMPETDAGRTGVFDTNQADTTTQEQATDVRQQVEPELDNANGQSVEVTPEQILNAIAYDQVTVAPKIAQEPVVIKGSEPSTQVTYVTPTVIGGANGTAPITADRIVTPKFDGKAVYTPAEQRADTSFDTEPVTDKTDDGITLADVAVAMVAAAAGGAYLSRRRQRKKEKKLKSKKRTSDVDNSSTDDTTKPDDTPNMPQDPPTTEQVQDEVDEGHNEQVNKNAANGKDIPSDIKVPPQPTATAMAVNREMWLRYLIETNQLGETGSQDMANSLYNVLRGFEFANLSVMTDLSYQQATDGTFADHRDWGDGEVDEGRLGVFDKIINFAAGASPTFDNFMGKLGIARGGHEADSSLASIALAQVRAKAQGANAQIYKFFVGPMLTRTKLLAQELRRGDDDVQLATGRVATANHVLNEAADAMWKGFEKELDHLRDSLAKVKADLAANPSNKDYPLRTMNTAGRIQDEITKLSELYNRTRAMYEGRTKWDGETDLPGGMTKARAEQDIADVKAEYGADFAKIEENAKELAKTILGIRQFATAAGVFTNEDLDMFNEIGFKEYVPLYAEERDPTNLNEEDNYTHTTTMDRLLQGIPLAQARAMGLTKDLSRYRRKGATSPAADGFTNMRKFALNMAGRVGQQNWIEMVQQLYEGTVGKPYSAANITNPDTLAELNASYDSGNVPGLIRVRPGMKNLLPSDIQAKIAKIRPIMAKGRNANGDNVMFEYYWTEPAIQAEIYANTNLTDTLTLNHIRSFGTATRAAARAVTVGRPVWSAYNWVRDSFERVSVMLMRPVKDRNGKLVPKWKLATEFFRALPMTILHSKDIFRYLVLGEVKTPIQTILNEAVGEGSINLTTSLADKNSILEELKKSNLEKVSNKISKWLGDTANKTGAGKVRNALSGGLDFYIVAITEIPQVSTALASYMAYQNVGVNKKESANRVRDAYDPLRANNIVIQNLGQFHPFVRSALSGGYNLARSLTQYWKPGEWQFTLAYIVGGTIGVVMLMPLIAGLFGEDEDGRSELARLPLSTLMGGIPVPWGENGVWTLPVGFGMNKFIWGLAMNVYRYIHGYQNASETALGVASLFVDNLSPVQVTGGSDLAENPTAAAILTAAPMLLKPLAEMALNKKSFGDGQVYYKDTPRGEFDSEQDEFNTPETYKKWAKWLKGNGFGDYRPETLRHLFESYTNLAGPASAIPQSIISDTSEKTLGNKQRKGEVFGPFLTAIGAGMSIQPNALDVANLTFEMQNRRYELHRKYGVGARHSEEMYEKYSKRGKRGGIKKDAKHVTEARLREKGASEAHIKYIINGMEFETKRSDYKKEFETLAMEYNRLVASGKEDLQLRKSVQDAWDAYEKLIHDYVKENNDVFFTLR